MRRAAALACLPLLAALALAGCFQNEVVIHVNPDGSGTIVETFLLTPAALEQMRAMRSPLGDDGEAFNPIDKDELTAQAAQFGGGVRFVSAEPLKSDAGEGYRATYAFDDVRKLDVQMDRGDPQMSAAADGPGLRFDFTPGDPASLAVRVPQDDEVADAVEDAERTDAMAGADSAQRAMAIDMMRGMLDGMRIRIAVAPQGTITSTNATYREGDRIVLLDVSGDVLLDDEGVLQRLAATQDPAAARALLADTPGLTVETQETVTVSFE
jgi:hypothetical protein